MMSNLSKPVFIATDFRVCFFENRIFISNKAFFIIERYYNAFGPIVLCTRVIKEKPDSTWFDATNYIYDVLLFESWKQFFTHSFKSSFALKVKNCSLIIARFESMPAIRASKFAKKFHIPYLAEVMSCAWDGYWNHGIIGKLLAPFVFLATKRAIRNANYALYVTKDFLQKRYPTKGKAINASNVYLDGISQEVLDKRLNKIQTMDNNHLTLMTTGAVYVKYKGQQYVIASIPLFNKIGINVTYYVAGEGNQSYLRKIAKKYGVEDQVIFTGKVSQDYIFELLDKADIYIHPSLQEGLPRALIEALSRACPSCGTKIAGIPELIQEKCLFAPKSRKAVFSTIINIVGTESLTSLATQNIDTAKGYINCLLSEKRSIFYNDILNDLLHQIG